MLSKRQVGLLREGGFLRRFGGGYFFRRGGGFLRTLWRSLRSSTPTADPLCLPECWAVLIIVSYAQSFYGSLMLPGNKDLP